LLPDGDDLLRRRALSAMSRRAGRSWRVGATLALAASACALPRPALANGRFPSAGHVEVDPADGAHIVVRVTYGLLVTRDGGAHWGWSCEEALGFTGLWDPPIGITTQGRILAGLPDGLALSRSDGCDWERAPALDGRLVVDLAVDRTNPARAVVLAVAPAGGGFDNRIFLTDDGGDSFHALSAPLPAGLRALTLDLVPSDPASMYVSGVLEGPVSQGVVLRSSDAGQSFETLPVPQSDAAHGPYIAAVDPKNAERLYVRLDGAPGQLFSSGDGGHTWEPIFTGEGPLLGFALAPDGAQLLVGGEKDGLWRSPAPAWAFEKASYVRARCLRWASAGVYACGEEALDGFAVGFSTTEGSTFGPLERTAELCGPLDCPAGTSIYVQCKSRWPVMRATLGASPCETAAPPDASTSQQMPPDPAPPGDCGCRAGPGGVGAAPAFLLGLVALVYRRRFSAPARGIRALVEWRGAGARAGRRRRG
jgi:photosystem II stability/assembly factor-like uncharacterized protein